MLWRSFMVILMKKVFIFFIFGMYVYVNICIGMYVDL